MAKQTPPPRQIVIVDSSDDHEGCAATVATMQNETTVPITLVSSPVGSSLQRNVGLRLTEAPVIFFPDDDALWYPDYARRILDVYERDVEGRVAAVGGLETSEFPPSIVAPTYEMTPLARLNRRVAPLRYLLESRLLPDPVRIAARRQMGHCASPDWIDGEDIVLVEYVTGFRMSFRRAFIAEQGFDEALSGYALYEDVDVSLRAWRRHLVVATHAARVVHHQRPGGRETGWRDGFFHLLNFAYVVCKNTEPGSRARRRLVPWGLYRSLQYCLRTQHRDGRQRVRGALHAVTRMGRLTNCTDLSELRRAYVELAASEPGAPAQGRWAARLRRAIGTPAFVTLTEAELVQASRELGKAAAPAADVVVGIATGGAHVARLLAEDRAPRPGLVTVSLQRPGTAVKQKGRSDLVLRHIPRRLAFLLRWLEVELREATLRRQRAALIEEELLTDDDRARLARAAEVLIVDDTVDSGRTLMRTVASVRQCNPTATIQTAVIASTWRRPPFSPSHVLMPRTLVRFHWSMDVRPQ